MTWIEVASDTVKIGLGTVVGGLFALLTARQAHKHRRSEEYIKRRRDQLERISESFDKVSWYVIDLLSSLLSVSEMRVSKEIKEAVLEETGHHPVGGHEAFMEKMAELHSIEARLALLALPHLADAVEEYRHAVTTASTEGITGRSEKMEREKLFNAILTQRATVITMMAQFYERG